MTDHKTFHTARREQREARSRREAMWILFAGMICALLISFLSGCSGNGTGGQQDEPQFVNPCACAYELLLSAADMKVLCKPCPPEVQ